MALPSHENAKLSCIVHVGGDIASIQIMDYGRSTARLFCTRQSCFFFHQLTREVGMWQILEGICTCTHAQVSGRPS